MTRILCLLALLPIAMLLLVSCEPYKEDFQAKFTNHLYTDIEVTVEGYGRRIVAPGATVRYWIDSRDRNYTFYARTSGKDDYGVRVGMLLEWNYTMSTVGSEYTTNLITESDIFFIKIRNNGYHNLNPLYVNSNSSAESVDNITIPNDGYTYSTGYYRAYLNTMVKAYWQGHPQDFTYWVQGNHFRLYWTNNQSVTLFNDWKADAKSAQEGRAEVAPPTKTLRDPATPQQDLAPNSVN